jgi:hypothetical protein
MDAYREVLRGGEMSVIGLLGLGGVAGAAGTTDGWGDMSKLSDRNACRVFRRLTHYIAAPPHRLDIVLAARCAGEFLPQFANKYVDDLHLWLKAHD